MTDQSDARPLRLALVQENATVGDLRGNAEIVASRTVEATQAGADLVVFPEMFLTGYPVEDLALRRSFIEASKSTLDTLPGRLQSLGCGSTTVVALMSFAASDLDTFQRFGVMSAIGISACMLLTFTLLPLLLGWLPGDGIRAYLVSFTVPPSTARIR